MGNVLHEHPPLWKHISLNYLNISCIQHIRSKGTAMS